MRDPASVKNHLPLKQNDFHILFELLDGQRHGYAIAKAILERSEGLVRIEAGNLHRTLRKLAREGLVSPSDKRPDPAHDDQRRRYWVLSELGRAVVAAEAARMSGLVRDAEARCLIPRASG